MASALTVRFWGVRGSIACSGPRTTRYGGNTSCIEVRCGERLLIFDGGTGLRYLGNGLKGPIDADLFLTLTIALLAGAWLVSKATLDDDAPTSPFVTTARVGEQATTRNLAVTVHDVRLAFGAVASRPWRARTAERVLIGATADAETFAAAADAELAAARPLPRQAAQRADQGALAGGDIDTYEEVGGRAAAALGRIGDAIQATVRAKRQTFDIVEADRTDQRGRAGSDVDPIQIAEADRISNGVGQGVQR